MSIGVKVVERPIEQVSYVRATLKGLTHTLKHMLNPEKVTTQYPEEKESISKRWRGTHRMLTTEDGKAKCVGPTASSLCRGKTSRAIAIRSSSRSTNSAASSAAIARKSARKRRFMWGG